MPLFTSLKGELEQASRFVEEALRLDENFSPALLLEVYLYLKAKNFSKCLEMLSKRRLKEMRVSTKV